MANELSSQDGRQIDQYTIQRPLGSGGMADVYLAWDNESRIHVALKLIHAKAMGSATLRERFRREVAIAQQLHHPYLVRVYGSGTAPDGRAYMVMEYVDGGNLAELIERRRPAGKAMSPQEAASLMRSVAAAMAYAHRKGVIHRDLKPANVMVRRDNGQPVITDLGIASVAGANPLTGTLETMGTPQYMAPEQAAGASEIDRRADIYAMGVMLYELLAGRRPFDADNVLAILNLKLNTDPPPLRQVRPDVDGRLAAVVETAMQRDPDRRYQSAGALATALDAYLPYFESERDDAPSTTPDPPATNGNPKPKSTSWPLPAVRPTWLAIGAISVVFVLLTVAALRRPAPQIAVTRAIAGVAKDEETPQPRTEATSTATGTPARTALPISTLSIASSNSENLDQPSADVTRSSTTTPDAFVATVTATLSSQASGEEVRVQPTSAVTPATTSNGSQTNLTNNAASDYDPQWSPDGAQIAFVSDRDGNYEIYLMNADGSGQTRLTNNAASDYDPQWSPDGAQIAFVSDRDGNYEIYVMKADGSGRTRLTNNTVIDYGPQWSPDGTQIVFSSGDPPDRGIYIINADGSGQTRLSNNNRSSDEDPQWSPDGTQIVFTSGRRGPPEIFLMNADGSGQTQLTENTESSYGPRWSPEGARIAFLSYRDGEAEIYVIDLSGETRLTDNETFDGEPQWSPDGAQIAFTSQRDGNNEIYVMSADGSGQTRLTNNEADDYGPQWSPDGTQIVFTSQREGNYEIYIMNVDGRGEAVADMLPRPTLALSQPEQAAIPSLGLLKMTACDGANIERFPANATINFRWHWPGQLPAGAYLEIRAGIGQQASLGRVPDSSRLANGTWEHQVSATALTEGAGDYRWQVVVMPSDGGTPLVHSQIGCFAIFDVGGGDNRPEPPTSTPVPPATNPPEPTDPPPLEPPISTPEPTAPGPAPPNTPTPGFDD